MARYAFEPQELREIALTHVGKPVPDIERDLVAELGARYPDLISTDMPWINSPAGLLMYQIKMLFARHNEYVGIMGIPVPNTGHTGRNGLYCYDAILSGEIYTAHPDERIPVKVSAGDFQTTYPWDAFYCHVPDHVFFLEYMRGPLAMAMPFGLANNIFSTCDWKTTLQLCRINSTLVWRSRRAPTPHRGPTGFRRSSLAEARK
jgi:hypothetical protein